jgi:hypothetical protein
MHTHNVVVATSYILDINVEHLHGLVKIKPFPFDEFDNIMKVFLWILNHWIIFCVVSMLGESTLTLDSLQPMFITN